MADEKAAVILSTRVICKQPGRYIGWPTIVRTKSGELLAVFSGDRDAHVCPLGKTQMIRSSDNGKTWSKPETINDTPADDRDAGIIQTQKGTLVVSWFTSVAFERKSQYSKQAKALTPELRKKWLGNWVRRSEDNGKTWGVYINSHVSAPHGPIELADGTLMYVGKNYVVGNPGGKRPAPEKMLAASVSTDDGKTWNISGYIPVPDHVKPGAEDFHEPHVVETDPGKLVALFRHHGEPGKYYLWQTESTDSGKTWTPLHQIKIWGYPPHLTKLANGWLLVVYGRRKKPFSERACISRDNGKSWDVENEITLAEAPNSDLGYPASVQLDDGSIYTIYYQIDKKGEKTSLMATHWKLGDGSEE